MNFFYIYLSFLSGETKLLTGWENYNIMCNCIVLNELACCLTHC